VSVNFFDQFCNDYYFYEADFYESRVKQQNSWIFGCTDDTQHSISYDWEATSNMTFCSYPFFVCHGRFSKIHCLIFMCKVQEIDYSFQYYMDNDVFTSKVRKFNKNRGLYRFNQDNTFLNKNELRHFHENLVKLFKSLPEYRLHFVTGCIKEKHDIDRLL